MRCHPTQSGTSYPMMIQSPYGTGENICAECHGTAEHARCRRRLSKKRSAKLNSTGNQLQPLDIKHV